MKNQNIEIIQKMFLNNFNFDVQYVERARHSLGLSLARHSKKKIRRRDGGLKALKSW